jgi:signal transduction histidine kinase
MTSSRTNLVATTGAVAGLLAWVAIWTQSRMGSSLLPHAFCITGSQPLLVLHVVGDALIAVAYTLIPLALVNIIRQRADIPFGWIAWLFGAFIVACGGTHALELWTLWDPVYWYSGVLKAFTAAVSLATAWVLYKLTPQILAIPSADALRKSNAELRSLLGDLETFSSSIAHDLRAPLTTLGGYSQVLLETEKDSLSPRGRDYLEKIGRAVARMDEISVALVRRVEETHRGSTLHSAR